VDHEEEIYPYLARLGAQVRARLKDIFQEHGIIARCTGHPNEAIPGSSLAVLHFPLCPDVQIDSPDVAADPACCMFQVRERLLKLALLLEDVYAVHGLGALSTAHTEENLAHLYAACDRVAQRLSKPMQDAYR
jgi:hypothetical protein